MSATQNADDLTGEENTGLDIFLGVKFILQPGFLLFASKSTRPMTRTKTFFSWPNNDRELIQVNIDPF